MTLVVALLVAGCAGVPNQRAPANAPPFGAHVVLIYVPGVGGFQAIDRAWLNGLRAGGFDGKTEVFDWTGQLATLAAYSDHTRQRAASHRISQRICRLHAESRATRFVLVGHSAGAGVAMHALEDLPPGVSVDSLLLLAPALSRTYDLSTALRHVRGRADVFYSDRDTLVLAFATSIFGTVDGVHGEAAGHAGFIKPPSASNAAYAILTEHGYSKDRRSLGDDGGHVGMLTPGVAATLVAPLLPGHERSGAAAIVQTDTKETIQARYVTSVARTAFEGTSP